MIVAASVALAFGIGVICGVFVKVGRVTGTDIRAAAELLLESVDDLVALARRNGLGHEPEVSDVEAEADALREAIAEAKQADIEIQSRAEQWR